MTSRGIAGYSDQQAAAALRSNPNRIQASDDPFEATHETVQYMCQLVRDSLADGIVQDVMNHLAQLAAAIGMPNAIWWWCKRNVKFVHHSRMLASWLGLPDELQLLIRPDALLKMAQPKGDCAVYTTLECAMLECAGIPWEIVTVAVDPRTPGIFSHVYPRAILSDGARLPMDASHGKFPGWEVPRDRVSALQVWDMNGKPIKDVAPQQKFEGLHGMYGYEGLGQDPTDPSTGDNPYVPTLPTDYSGFTDQTQIGTPMAGSGQPTGGGGSSSGSGVTNVYNIGGGGSGANAGTNAAAAGLQQLASQFASIFGATQGVTQVQRNANGTYSVVAPAAAASALNLSSGSGSSLLLWGGIAVAAILLISALKK